MLYVINNRIQHVQSTCLIRSKSIRRSQLCVCGRHARPVKLCSAAAVCHRRRGRIGIHLNPRCLILRYTLHNIMQYTRFLSGAIQWRANPCPTMLDRRTVAKAGFNEVPCVLILKEGEGPAGLFSLDGSNDEPRHARKLFPACTVSEPALITAAETFDSSNAHGHTGLLLYALLLLLHDIIQRRKSGNSIGVWRPQIPFLRNDE